MTGGLTAARRCRPPPPLVRQTNAWHRPPAKDKARSRPRRTPRCRAGALAGCCLRLPAVPTPLTQLHPARLPPLHPAWRSYTDPRMRPYDRTVGNTLEWMPVRGVGWGRGLSSGAIGRTSAAACARGHNGGVQPAPPSTPAAVSAPQRWAPAARTPPTPHPTTDARAQVFLGLFWLSLLLGADTVSLGWA